MATENQEAMYEFDLESIFYSTIENLVLRARSEMIGSAIDKISSWFQVSGFRCQ